MALRKIDGSGAYYSDVAMSVFLPLSVRYAVNWPFTPPNLKFSSSNSDSATVVKSDESSNVASLAIEVGAAVELEFVTSMSKSDKAKRELKFD